MKTEISQVNINTKVAKTQMLQTFKNHQNAKVAKKQMLAKRNCGQNTNVTQAHLLQNSEVRPGA